MKKQHIFSLFFLSTLSLFVPAYSMTKGALVRKAQLWAVNGVIASVGAAGAISAGIVNSESIVVAFLGVSGALCLVNSKIFKESDPIRNLQNITSTLDLQRKNKLLRSRYVANSNAFLRVIRAQNVDQARPYAAAFNNLTAMKKELVKAKLVLKAMPQENYFYETELRAKAEVNMRNIVKQTKMIDSLLNILHNDEQAKKEIEEDNKISVHAQILSEHLSKKNNNVAQRA